MASLIIQTYQNKANNLCNICFVFDWTVNANSWKQNIIVIKEICSWLPPWMNRRRFCLQVYYTLVDCNPDTLWKLGLLRFFWICRTSCFYSVMQQLARFCRLRRVVRSVCGSRASCEIVVMVWCEGEINNSSCYSRPYRSCPLPNNIENIATVDNRPNQQSQVWPPKSARSFLLALAYF